MLMKEVESSCLFFWQQIGKTTLLLQVYIAGFLSDTRGNNFGSLMILLVKTL